MPSIDYGQGATIDGTGLTQAQADKLNNALVEADTDDTINGNGADVPLSVALSLDANNELIKGTDNKLFVKKGTVVVGRLEDAVVADLKNGTIVIVSNDSVDPLTHKAGIYELKAGVWSVVRIFKDTADSKIPEVTKIADIADNQKVYRLTVKDGDNEIGYYAKDEEGVLHTVGVNKKTISFNHHIQIDTDFNYKQYVIDNKIAKGDAISIVNINGTAGIDITIDNTKDLQLKSIQNEGVSIVTKESNFRLGANQVIRISYDDTKTYVTASPTLDKGYKATVELLQAIPSNILMTGSFVHVGTDTWIYHPTSNTPESDTSKKPTDLPVGASGRWLTNESIVVVNKVWKANDLTFKKGDRFTQTRNSDGKRYIYEVKDTWTDADGLGNVWNQTEEDRYTALSEDKRPLLDSLICTNTVTDAPLPANIPKGDKVFSIVTNPNKLHSIMVSNGDGSFHEFDKNTLANYARLEVKDTDSVWHYNVQNGEFKQVEQTALKIQFDDAITKLGLADTDKNVQKAIEALKLLVDGLPDQISKLDIAERDAIVAPTANSIVHVIDAKEDATVTKGWCKYQYIDGVWIKYLAEEDLNILELDDLWIDKLHTSYAVKGLTSFKQLDEWFKGKSVDGLWGSPVADKAELKALKPKDDATRTVLGDNKTYRFKTTARLSATEKTDTANVTPDAPNDTFGLWVVSKESRLLTETIGKYDGSGDGTLQILNSGLTWNGLKAMGFTHVTLMGEVLVNATIYPIESTTITTKDEMGSPVTYFNFTQDDATTNTANQVLTMKIQTPTQANTGSLDTYHSESGIHHVNVTVIGHRGFEQKEYVEQNTVEVEKLSSDSGTIAVAGGKTNVGTSSQVLIPIKSAIKLKAGGKYEIDVNSAVASVDGVGRQYYLVLGDGSVNPANWKASSNTEAYTRAAGYITTPWNPHIEYNPTVDETLDLYIVAQQSVNSTEWLRPAQKLGWFINQKPQSTIMKPTIINPSAAIVPNGYEIKVIKGTTNPDNSVLNIDISAEIPDGKEILGIMSSKIDYSTGFVTPDTVGSIDYQIFMSSATNLRVQGITSSGLYNKPFKAVLQLANKTGGYTQGVPEGGEGTVAQDMSLYMLKTDYDANNNKIVDFVDEETDGGVI